MFFGKTKLKLLFGLPQNVNTVIYPKTGIFFTEIPAFYKFLSNNILLLGLNTLSKSKANFVTIFFADISYNNIEIARLPSPKLFKIYSSFYSIIILIHF